MFRRYIKLILEFDTFSINGNMSCFQRLTSSSREPKRINVSY